MCPKRRWGRMFAAVAPESVLAYSVPIVCFLLVLAFEFSNGFHDTANAVATVIYPNSLKPVPGVILSGAMNFLGVVLGGGGRRLYLGRAFAAGRADPTERQSGHPGGGCAAC